MKILICVLLLAAFSSTEAAIALQRRRIIEEKETAQRPTSSLPSALPSSIIGFITSEGKLVKLSSIGTSDFPLSLKDSSSSPKENEVPLLPQKITTTEKPVGLSSYSKSANLGTTFGRPDWNALQNYFINRAKPNPIIIPKQIKNPINRGVPQPPTYSENVPEDRPYQSNKPQSDPVQSKNLSPNTRSRLVIVPANILVRIEEPVQDKVPEVVPESDNVNNPESASTEEEQKIEEEEQQEEEEEEESSPPPDVENDVDENPQLVTKREQVDIPQSFIVRGSLPFDGPVYFKQQTGPQQTVLFYNLNN